MNEKLLSLKDEIKSRLGETQDLTDLDKIRVSYLGKKGSITALLKGMKDLPNEERKTFGAEVNIVPYMAEAASCPMSLYP